MSEGNVIKRAGEVEFRCGACRKRFVHTTKGHSGSAGYAMRDFGDSSMRICYHCSALAEATDMIATGVTNLYLTRWLDLHYISEHLEGRNNTGYVCCNWPGTLVFPVERVSISDHNIAGPRGRWDFWFIGPEGHRWHGLNIGDGEIAKVTRTKERVLKTVPVRDVYTLQYPYKEIR